MFPRKRPSGYGRRNAKDDDLVWCENIPKGRVFLTADRRLREAALLAGFDARQV